ncbi:hypothetical protein OK016_26935 [Vibrio chagasii]|nr:hypothetical protein [Vibrio chagasii]
MTTLPLPENGVIQGLIPIIILCVGFLRRRTLYTITDLATVGAFAGVISLGHGSIG